MTPHHIIAFTENVYSLCKPGPVCSPVKEKQRMRKTDTLYSKVFKTDSGFRDLLVSNLLVSSPHHLCDPSLSPWITAPSACRKCLGVFTGENRWSTKIFSISTGTNFTLHSCSLSAVPQRPSRIWLRYTETWLIFYGHSFPWYIFKETAYISILWKKLRLLF